MDQAPTEVVPVPSPVEYMRAVHQGLRRGIDMLRDPAQPATQRLLFAVMMHPDGTDVGVLTACIEQAEHLAAMLQGYLDAYAAYEAEQAAQAAGDEVES